MCDCYTVYQCIQLTLWKWGNMLVVILCIVTRVVMKLKLANIKDENNGSKFWVGAPWPCTILWFLFTNCDKSFQMVGMLFNVMYGHTIKALTLLLRLKSKISFTMEASPLLTVNDYNLIYVCVKQAWLQCMLY